MRRRVFRLICGLFPVLTIATAALAGQPTVTHWFSGPYATYEFVKKQIPEFERANPDVRIELLYVNPNDVFEKYLVMFATGVAVDVIWTNNTYNLPYYVSRNFLLPLNNIARKYEFGFSDFVRPVVDAATRGGQVYGIPYAALPAPGLFYIEDFFDQAGLSYPDKDWRYEAEFAEAARKLTVDRDGNSVPDRYGLNGLLTGSRKWSVYAILSAFGGRILSLDGSKATVADAKTIAGLRYLGRLANQDRTMGGSYWQTTAAMDLDGYWAIAGFTQTIGGARWGAAPIPLGPEGRKVIFHAGYYSVPRTATNPDGAVRWIKHLVSDEVGRAWVAGKLNMTAKMRVNTSPALLSDEATRTWITFYEFEGEPPPVPANFRVSNVDAAFAEAMDQSARNEAGVEVIAAQLQRRLTGILSQPVQ